MNHKGHDLFYNRDKTIKAGNGFTYFHCSKCEIIIFKSKGFICHARSSKYRTQNTSNKYIPSCDECIMMDALE